MPRRRVVAAAALAEPAAARSEADAADAAAAAEPPPPLRKLHSEGHMARLQAETNKNVSWMSDPHWWPAYVVVIIAVRVLLSLFLSGVVSPELQWTAVNLIHAAISFWSLHWMRGTPFWEDQNDFIEQTVWEQIDNGVPWTTTRKLFIIIPIALYLVTSYASEWDGHHLAVNTAVLAVLILAKLPEMHGVRLLHLNEAHVD